MMSVTPVRIKALHAMLFCLYVRPVRTSGVDGTPVHNYLIILDFYTQKYQYAGYSNNRTRAIITIHNALQIILSTHVTAVVGTNKITTSKNVCSLY